MVASGCYSNVMKYGTTNTHKLIALARHLTSHIVAIVVAIVFLLHIFTISVVIVEFVVVVWGLLKYPVSLLKRVRLCKCVLWQHKTKKPNPSL